MVSGLLGGPERLAQVVGRCERRDPAVRQDLDGTGVLQATHGGRALRRRQVDLVGQPHGVDGLADGGHPIDLVGVDLPGARLEPPQAEVLGTAEEDRVGRLAVAAGTSDLLEVRVERRGWRRPSRPSRRR